MNSPLSNIISREYFTRVKRKSFIISTLLMPVFMIGLMVLPALITLFNTPEEKRIAVVDRSEIIAPTLQNTDEVHFVMSNATVDELKGDDAYYGFLYIGPDIIDNPSDVSFYTHSASSLELERQITSQIKHTIEARRLQNYNIENLNEILAAVNADVNMQTYRLDKDQESETSSMFSFIIGLVMSFMLYMFILIYGQMVLTSIIEEKNNRVLEIVVSSVKPFYLMLGKIVGIGLVAVTQILIWVALIVSFTTWVMPSLIVTAAAGADADTLSMLSQIGNVWYVLQLCGYLLLFLIGGYFFYSSIYAAIGSAVDNIQDASQLQTFAMVPIILGMVVSPTAVADPNSALAFWVSIIPLTSPIVMVARIPFGIPTWEILISCALLYGFTIFMIWLAAKIYRVGIFMYGKKPTITELIRWARYK